jgi:hypothetical protein
VQVIAMTSSTQPKYRIKNSETSNQENKKMSPHKKEKRLKNRIWLLGALAIAVFSGQAALADANLQGAFRSDDEKVEIILRSLGNDGREGSYLGAMIRYKDGDHPQQVMIYLVDPHPVGDGTYMMVPRVVTEDGMVIGSRNPNPCLTLTEEGYGKKGVNFSIATEKRGCAGFAGSWTFTGKKSPAFKAWGNYVPGRYEVLNDKKQFLNLNKALGSDNETGINSKLADMDLANGRYVFRHEYPGLFTIQRTYLSAYGTDEAKNPSKIGLFLNSGGGNDGLVLVDVDPARYGNIIRLDRK